MTKIEELENKMLEIAQEIAELKKGQNAGEWKPQDGDEYWFINTAFEVVFAYWYNHRVDIERAKYNLIFKTKEECQKYCDYRKALNEKSYKFSREEWSNNLINKYVINYNNDTNEFEMDKYLWLESLNCIYFKTEEDAQYMIDNYSEEMLKWGLL